MCSELPLDKTDITAGSDSLYSNLNEKRVEESLGIDLIFGWARDEPDHAA